MDKYGVVTDPEKEKTANTAKICPTCGASLNEAGHCPTHGTEPFEKKPEKK